jgi:hypothetical protein
MSRVRAVLLAALLVLGAGLAGCLAKDDLETGDQKKAGARSQGGPTEDLFGWVHDGAFSPVPGVLFTVVGADATATSNETGFFGFPVLPRQESLIVIAEHERYVVQSKKILLPVEGSMRLNFTLDPRPEKKGYMEVIDFNGLLSCQAVVEIHEGHFGATGGAGRDAGGEEENATVVNCGFLDPNNQDRWEFSVGPELAGAIIEVSWEPDSGFSEHLHLVVETTGFGAEDAVLAEVKGPSVLSAQITTQQAQRFYGLGGIVRASLRVDPNINDQETGIGIAAAYQQAFTIHASLFYVEPPPAHYTVHAQ